MQNNNKKGIQIGLGINFILMIFVVLCMMILSLLSYREAFQKELIALRQKEYQEAYMNADADIQYVLRESEQTSFQDVEELVKNEQFKMNAEAFQITYKIQQNQLHLEKRINDEQLIAVCIKQIDGKLIIESYQVKEKEE